MHNDMSNLIIMFEGWYAGNNLEEVPPKAVFLRLFVCSYRTPTTITVSKKIMPMNSNTVRHRAAAKQHAPARTLSWDSNPKGGSSITQQNKKIHAGLLYRVISIVSLFTITVLLISRADKSHRITRISGGRENISFVTVVMPR